jgi:hypothetical protein
MTAEERQCGYFPQDNVKAHTVEKFLAAVMCHV